MFIPSRELLFQYGDVLDPVVDWKVSGTFTKPAPGEVIMSAQLATGIRSAATKIPRLFIFSPIGSHAGPFGNGQRSRAHIMNITQRFVRNSLLRTRRKNTLERLNRGCANVRTALSRTSASGSELLAKVLELG